MAQHDGMRGAEHDLLERLRTASSLNSFVWRFRVAMEHLCGGYCPPFRCPPNPGYLKAKNGAADARVTGTVGFRGVPEAVWNFHIGGYQVCEKWLKDRKGRTLTAEDIVYYHRIVIALHETIRVMSEIDEIIDRHGGWPRACARTHNPTVAAVASRRGDRVTQ